MLLNDIMKGVIDLREREESLHINSEVSKEDTPSLNKKRRNHNIDLIKIFAVFSVISVHFFLYSGFYEQEIEGISEYFVIVARTFFMVCVPLFLITSGFLMNKKELSKRYYKGIVKIIAVYILASAACAVFRVRYLYEDADIWGWVESIFDYSAAPYSWYVEMYIGLFLLIPFLNLAYNGLKSKKGKLVLIFTFVSFTALPTVINYQVKVFPDYWRNVYPITYYFIGAFLSEFKVNIKKRYILIALLACLFIFGGFNYYQSVAGGTGTIKLDIYSENWCGFENFIDSVLVFMFIQKINLERLPDVIKAILKKLSELTLGAYLLSYIFDMIFYNFLNDRIIMFYDKAPYYFIIVPMIFVCSMLGSLAINLIIGVFKRNKKVN